MPGQTHPEDFSENSYTPDPVEPHAIDRAEGMSPAPEPVEWGQREAAVSPEPVEWGQRESIPSPEPVEWMEREAAVSPEPVEWMERASTPSPEPVEFTNREAAQVSSPENTEWDAGRNTVESPAPIDYVAREQDIAQPQPVQVIEAAEHFDLTRINRRTGPTRVETHWES